MFGGVGGHFGGDEFHGALAGDGKWIIRLDRRVEFGPPLDVWSEAAEIGFDGLAEVGYADFARQFEHFHGLLKGDVVDAAAGRHRREARLFFGFLAVRVLGLPYLEHGSEAADAGDDRLAGFGVVAEVPRV